MTALKAGFTEEQIRALAELFETLGVKDDELVGWCRDMEVREDDEVLDAMADPRNSTVIIRGGEDPDSVNGMMTLIARPYGPNGERLSKEAEEEALMPLSGMLATAIAYAYTRVDGWPDQMVELVQLAAQQCQEPEEDHTH